MPALTESRALTIVAEFPRIAHVLRTAEYGQDAALAQAIERVNGLGCTVHFRPSFVSVEVIGWSNSASSREDRSYCVAFAACLVMLATAARKEMKEANRAAS